MGKDVLSIASGLAMAALSLRILKEYFETFLQTKMKKKRIIWLSYFLWQIYTILQLDDMPVYVNIIVSVAFVFCISLLCYNGNVSRKIIFTIMYVSIWTMVEFLVGYIFMALNINFQTAGLVGSFASKLLLLILVEVLRRFFDNDSIQEVSGSYSIAFMLVLTGSIFIVYESFSRFFVEKSVWSSFIALLIMLSINILMFNTYLRLSENFVLKRNNLVFKQAIDLYEIHMQEKENSMKNYQRAKHDMKHHLICLKEMLQKKQYPELNVYLENLLVDGLFANMFVADTDNSVIDAIVNYKYAMAQNNNIDFELNLQIPTSLPFDNSDLCIILGNALDNAIEANKRTDSKESRFIKLWMRMDNKNLIIIIENYFDGNIRKNRQGKILSVKEDTENHGIGMYSIQKSVEKYHGYMAEKYEGNIFRLEIILYS